MKYLTYFCLCLNFSIVANGKQSRLFKKKAIWCKVQNENHVLYHRDSIIFVLLVLLKLPLQVVLGGFHFYWQYQFPHSSPVFDTVRLLSFCKHDYWKIISRFTFPWLLVKLNIISHGYCSPVSKNTGVGCHFLLQGILTQGSNLCLVSPALAGGFFSIAPPRRPQYMLLCSVMSNSVTPWTVAHPAPLSMEFSRQEYWNGLPFPSPGDLLDPGIKPGSPALQADSSPSEPPGKPSPYM